ncbi:uncharacterized protein LOC130748916 isoform X2 [Lotus japonicus]|uniref:uncharacterized protein LOC130748916 isoform X2 n=1 Tax=Lotus japonicus TaxID=34305 RepID=UPI0025862B17|nr:uncharacterized protein LOC130748916 isoform X2 [Lotus japonicus]
MDSFLNHLPPLKRHRLIHQHQNQNTPTPSSLLPAKKRKESRNSATSHTNDTVSPSPTVCYPLPTKKRVFALQPHPQNDTVSSFDLNVEYQPSPNRKSHKTSEKPEPKSESIPEPESVLKSESVPEHEFESEPKSESDPKSVSEPEPEQLQQNQHEHAIDDDGDGDEEDGILCCVCQSTDGDAEDPIVFCDGCDLMVHASCYGNPLSTSIPDGDWFCERCRFGDQNSECQLCPVKEGAMKRTTEGMWAHVVCALIVPEVFFADPEGRDGIDCSRVPKKRWSEKCYVCGCGGGCAVVCSEPKCGLAFHASCAMKEELCIEYKQDRKGATIVAGFCKTHSLLWEKLSGKYKIVAVEDKK